MLALFIGGGDESTAGEVVGFAQQASRSLLDGGDGLRGEELGFHPGDGEMMSEVELHLLEVNTLEVTASDDTGGQRSWVLRCSRLW